MEVQPQHQGSWRLEEEREDEERVFQEYNYPSPEALLNPTLLTLPICRSPPSNFSDHGNYVLDSDTNLGQKTQNSEDDHHKMMHSTRFMGFTPFDCFEMSNIIKERMTQALKCFKDSTEQNQLLAQFWAPVKSGSHCVLATSGQPFVLVPHSNGLNQYRTVSLMHMFSIDGENVTSLGLPGRVFRHKLPEWTPNAQYYTSKENPLVRHAKHFNVRGTLALPVFEPSGQSCVGVLEVAMSSQKINYAPKVDKICKALEAVNLKSSEILNHPNIQICNEGRQNALAEILEVLTEVCETHKVPLAQTWVPCRNRCVLAYGGGVKKTCSSFDGSCMGQVCISTTDVAFYVVDSHMWGFREACIEHHLQKEQGVAGRSFSSHGLSYCRDISLFCKIEYPLVHYARMFRLAGSFAICLRSKHSGDDDYILEFFLPLGLKDSREQLDLVDSILATVKQNLQNLFVASGKKLEDARKHLEVIEVLLEDESLVLPVKSSSLAAEIYSSDYEINLVPENNLPYLETIQTEMTSTCIDAKDDKEISREDIVQLFPLKLVDAAKKLGVSKSTLKRKCRTFKIDRWPSKNNKDPRKFKSRHGPASSAQKTSSTPTNPVSNHGMTGSARIDGTCNFFPVKASYKEDFIRFNISSTSNVIQLKEEVSNRLSLDSNSFKLKYHDDEDDPVLITCDTDLQHFLCNSGLSKSKAVRLLIIDSN